jgi:hypothetical protein
MDTQTNIFGGFTPIPCDRISTWPCTKGDPGLESFVFTLVNPHGSPPSKFALNLDKSGFALFCHQDWGGHSVADSQSLMSAM